MTAQPGRAVYRARCRLTLARPAPAEPALARPALARPALAEGAAT
jgi:hypothetical protein